MAACPTCGRENADDARFCSACGAQLSGDAREVRKTVTIVFSDVVGSTAVGERLDPESLRRVMSRYFDAMAGVLTRHGGSVEKFIGDAIMAVFGIPVVHEDDALRAVRATVEMRGELARLNEELARDYGVTIENRTGVNTGEVVSGDPSSGQRLVTGDSVNVAARLEQAAGPGEILLGTPTYLLVEDAVDAEPVDPVAAKGKAEAVAAHRLRSVVAGAEPFRRRFESVLVGRERELELLRHAYRRAVDEDSCHLFTLLGSAGIGKSRVAQEFAREVAADARVLTGHALSYGEGVTYWPLIEILEQLGDEATVAELLAGEPDAREIANTMFSAIGRAETASSPEEIPWSVRRLLEALAREQPLVVVLDDLHWSEPTFLDLVEHVADFSRDAPILLVCLARPELLEARPGWAGGKLNATSLLLEPLSADAAGDLIGNLPGGTEVPAAIRRRVLEAADGNPLFVEQMLAHWSEESAAEELVVPPTIQALLAARVDRLSFDDRMVIERASVIGSEFWLPALEALMPATGGLHAALQQLVRKELIRPHRSTTFRRDDAYRFRHILIRETAYVAMPKEARADLHERFASWLDAERSEYDEIVGYHLDQAFRYRTELGPLDAAGRELGQRAGERLGAAGEGALARGDFFAALALLERAAEILPVEHPRGLELRLALGDALALAGDITRTAEIFSALAESAALRDDPAIEWRARASLGTAQVFGLNTKPEDLEATVDRAIAVLTELGDDEGLARAWRLAADLANGRGDLVGLEEAARRALVHARRAGDVQKQTELASWLGVAVFFGMRPVDEADDVLGELQASATTNVGRAYALFWDGALRALGGDVDALDDAARGRAMFAELGMKIMHGATGHAMGTIHQIRGEHGEAEHVLREAIAELAEAGDRGFRASILVLLAESLVAQGKVEEASEALKQAESAAGDESLERLTRRAQAAIELHLGNITEAERLARRSVLEPVAEAPLELAESELTLAIVLRARGDDEESAQAAARALSWYERKGAVPGAERARAFIAELDPA